MENKNNNTRGLWFRIDHLLINIVKPVDGSSKGPAGRLLEVVLAVKLRD